MKVESKTQARHLDLGIRGAPPPQPNLIEWDSKIINADCLETMSSMPRESIGAIITSPPYNIKNSTGNGLKCGKSGKWPQAELLNGYDEYADNLPHSEYVEWQRDCLAAMMRILKPTGAIFYNHKWRVQNGLMQDRQDILSGFPVRQIIIWQRSGGINFNPGYFVPTYEVIYLIAKPAFVLANGANKHGDVWRIHQETDNAHPAPFPLKLVKRCVASVPPSVGTILDPFIGSGTTAIAAQAHNRRWIGIEKSAKYCEYAKQRLSQI